MTASIDKRYKKLYSSYNKKLLALHKANFSVLGNNLDYFVTYLKLLRDHYILTDSKKDTDKLKSASLIAAVKEYENYLTCIAKYYKWNGKEVVQISDEPEEEVEQKYDDERIFHWTKFWELVALNIEDWGVN